MKKDTITGFQRSTIKKFHTSTSSKVVGGHNMVKAQHSEWKSRIAGENVSPSMSITIPCQVLWLWIMHRSRLPVAR
jgi:hypothetical protein